MSDIPIYIWDLQMGDTFVIEDDPETQLVYLGMDGMYAKVRAVDMVKHKEMCARYDARADFFCVMTSSSVRKLEGGGDGPIHQEE